MTKKAAAQYLVAGCVSLIAAVSLAEAYLAFRAQARPSLPFYNRLYPYVMFRPPESTTFVSADKPAMSHHKRNVEHYTNEDGLRVSAPGYALPRKKPAGQLRIAFLGGSAVQLGSTFETTLPGSLKTLLQAKYPGRDIEVINAGIQSCVSRQSIAHLVFTVVDYQPNIVILHDGVNDLGLPLTYESRANFPYNFTTMEEAWEAYQSQHQASLLRLLLDRSYLAAALRSRFAPQQQAQSTAAAAVSAGLAPHALPAREIAGNTAFLESHVAGYLSNWQKLVDLSRAYHYKPVCILQPTAALDRDFALKITMEQFGLEPQTAEEWQEALSQLYGEASRQIGALREKNPDVIFLDMKSDLLPAEEYFWDLVHVYDEINMQLAERIYENIKPLVDESLAAGNS
jgi:hypothetical protein